MSFQCDGCESIFGEKRNLHQHMRIRHGFKKYKCEQCNFRSNDQSHVRTHQKSKHGNELFICEQCDYTANVKSNLNRHIRSNHLEKRIKCEECNFVTDRKGALKRHIQAKHTTKKCNECEYTSLSLHDMNNHKNTRHASDNATLNSAFNRTLCDKTWLVKGNKDPLDVLAIYKSKIRNEIRDYIEEKEATKWYIGMKVKMYKIDNDGNKYAEVHPGFTSKPALSPTMMNFDSVYKNHQEKIMNDFVAFNANGSGWILDRVSEICLHMTHYTTGAATSSDTSSTDYDNDEPMVYDTANKERDGDDEDLLDENGYFLTPELF